MPFCANCGSPVEGRYCAKCGTPAGSPPTGPSATGAGSGELAANVAGTLCYIPVLVPAIVFLVLEPYSRNREIRFHAFQSLILQIAWVALMILLGMLLPVAGWGLWFTLSRLVHLAVLLLVVVLMWRTYQNQKLVLPVIGEYAEKLA